MNKKKIALLLAGIMTVASLALVGCGSKDDSNNNGSGQTQEQGQEEQGQAEEGTKTYTYTKESVVVELKYENGKPVDVVIDEVQEGASKRELCAKGEYTMKEGETEENNWAAQADALAAFIKENNFDLSKVGSSEENPKTDAVTGVTIKVNGYVAAVQEAMDKIADGSLLSNEDVKTYKYEKDTIIVELKYAEDKPVAVVIDEVQGDATKRELCAKGEYVMKEGETEENNWAAQADALAAFIEENNFDLAKVGSSEETQTTDAVTGVTIKVNGYVTAVQEAMDKIADGSLAESK